MSDFNKGFEPRLVCEHCGGDHLLAGCPTRARLGKYEDISRPFDVCGPQPKPEPFWPRVIVRDGKPAEVVKGDGDFLPGQPWPGPAAPEEPTGVFNPTPENHIPGMEPYGRSPAMCELHWAKAMLPGANNPKHAAGIRKPQLNLVPSIAMILMAKVFELGAVKYGPFNWRDAAVVRSIYLAAAMRHLLLMADGQDIDDESGQPHSAHVQACMAIIQDAEALGMLVDDRPTAGALPGVLASLAEKPQGGAR